jgi:hypothetical protein
MTTQIPNTPTPLPHPIMDAVDRSACFMGYCLIGGVYMVYAVPVAAVVMALTVPLYVPFAIRSLIKYGDCRAVPECVCIIATPRKCYYYYKLVCNDCNDCFGPRAYYN